MHRVFHRWNEGYTRIAAGCAFLALSVIVPYLGTVCLLAAAGSFLAAAIRYLVQKRDQDVGNLVEATRRFRRRQREEGEEIDDGDPEDHPAPYCAECDEVYYPGAQRCLLCRRPLI